jgi:hypothetical protein
MKKRALFISFIIIMAMHALCFAREINFDLKIEKEEISQGKQTELKAIFYGDPDIPAPEIPFVDGLNFKYVRPDKKEASSGADTPSVIHIYRVAALRAGSFDIGPVIFNYNGDTYTSGPLKLIVKKEEKLPVPTVGISEKSSDISGHIYLKLDVPNSVIFVNEEMPFKIMLFSDWLDLENISLVQKPSENLIIRKFDDRIIRNIEKDGVKYIILEYGSSLSAATPGAYQLNPVEVTFDVTLPKGKNGAAPESLNNNKEFYEGFIGYASSRSVTLESPAFTITSKEIPTENRPDDFKGAIGKFNFDVKVLPDSVKAGEKFTLTMSIDGAGNYNTVAMPILGAIAGAKVYDPKIIKGKDSITSEQIIKVESSEFTQIPQVTFSFFDPHEEKFVTIQKGPIEIKVEGYEKRPVSKKLKTEQARNLNIVPLKESTGALHKYNMRFYRNGIFIVLGIIPILAVFAASIIRKRVRFLEANPDYAAMLRASKKAHSHIVKAQELLRQGKAPEFYSAVFNIMQGYLGERAVIPKGGITAKILDDIPPSMIDAEICKKMKKMFSDCYMAKYTTSSFDAEDMAGTLGELKHVIDELDKKEFNI